MSNCVSIFTFLGSLQPRAFSEIVLIQLDLSLTGEIALAMITKRSLIIRDNDKIWQVVR
jgi:hypothetical protein